MFNPLNKQIHSNMHSANLLDYQEIHHHLKFLKLHFLFLHQ